MPRPPPLPAAALAAFAPRKANAWRVEDEILLQRLEDESVVERLFALYTSHATTKSVASRTPNARAGGLIAEIRKVPNGARVVRGALETDDVTRLARFVDALVLKDCPPELLHHLALFHGRGATALEKTQPDIAANAWIRSLAAWLALAEERVYLAKLEDAVLGDDPKKVARRNPDASIPPERVPLEVIADIARRADDAARELRSEGRAALIALARTDEAAFMAGASQAAERSARVVAERRRNKAVESALAVIGEGLDEASARGELVSNGRILLLRAIPVWTWTASDVAVEHFVIDRLDKIGWELYRARNWDSLRYLLDPFRPMIDSLATRIENDPTQIAYAAGCAQMFVFLAEVDRNLHTKLITAERSVRVCPTHRNGRLVLASVLCDQAISAMRQMVVFARKEELERVEKMLERAESLYPTTSELPEAKGMLERVKKGRITV